jgi:hypothetical protein
MVRMLMGRSTLTIMPVVRETRVFSTDADTRQGCDHDEKDRESPRKP